MPTTPTFTLYKGEDAYIPLTVVDQAGAAKNLTGATVTFRLGDTRVGSTVFEKAGAVDDGAAGEISVVLTNAETALWDVRTYHFQFIVEDATGDLQVVKSGIVEIKNLLATP